MKLIALRLPLVGLFLGLLLTACTVSLLSAYDERTDVLTSNLHRAMASHFEQLRTAQAPACLHDNYRDFYRERRLDIGALDLRVRSIPQNDPTIAQVEGLASSLNSLEELHRLKSPRCLSAAEISPIESNFGVQFRSILTLEQAKKRGAD